MSACKEGGKKGKEKSPETSELKISLGKEQNFSPPGLQWVPDGHASMAREDDQVKLWVAAGPNSYLLQGTSLETLGQPLRVLGPEGRMTNNGYDGYASFGSVIPRETKGKLIGFYHQEHWPNQATYFPFRASIGIVTSKDSGVTWQNKRIILEGKKPEPFPNQRVSGAGQPCAIIKGNEVYLYYIDWNDQQADAIHLARAPLDSVENPKAWQRWTEKGFAKPGEIKSDPVISPAKFNPDALYAALPGISFNTHFEKYLAVFETDLGFNLGLSEDAINWHSFRQFFPFPQRHSQRRRDQTWYSYPTILNPEANSDRKTNRKNWLVYGKGVWNAGAHYMQRRLLILE